ncbi:hypothetical protein V5799_019750 [Amblyomma americanum]|uniref:Dna-directed rna polymerase iii subunit rpc4 n=1 Tax=Amblyomma americanum TaxID=6943 RepID=A0AAQ4EVV4_AMBAM
MSYGQDLLWLARWSKFESEPVEEPKYQAQSSSSQVAKKKLRDDKELKALLRSDFIDDGFVDGPWLAPTTLPLAGAPVPVPEQKPGIAVDGRITKEESLQGPDLGNSVSRTALQTLSVADLCTSPNIPETGQLLFFQLPDTLPGLQAAVQPTQKEGTDKVVKTEEHQVRNGQTKLKHFPEGYIGKLQVMKSGRVQLVLGSVALIVDMGTSMAFHHELMSLRVKEGAADICILGQVMHKLICLPDMEQLLQAADS